MVTALPMTAYATAFPSGKEVSALGTVWWESMSTGNKVFSIVTSCSALTTNTLTTAKYLYDSVYTLKNDLVLCCTQPSIMLKTSLYLLLATSAGLAAATLSYEAFIEHGKTLAICMAAFQLTSYTARRYAGSASFFNRIIKRFNEDAQFQEDIIDELNRINPEHLDRIKQVLNENQDTEINEENILHFLERIYDQAQELKHSENVVNLPFFKPVTMQAQAANITGCIFDFTTSATLACFYYMLNGQKGYDGVNLITKMITGEFQLGGINSIAKQGIAFLPGLASSLQVAANGLDIRTTYYDVYQKIKECPILLSAALLLVSSSALAATAMVTASKGVTKHNNLFEIKQDSIYGTLFVTFTWMGNFCTLNNMSFQQALLSSEDKTVSLPNLVQYLKKHNLSKENIGLIKKHRFFSHAEQELILNADLDYQAVNDDTEEPLLLKLQS